MNRHDTENSSMIPRNAFWAASDRLSASSRMITLQFDIMETVDANLVTSFRNTSIPDSLDALMNNTSASSSLQIARATVVFPVPGLQLERTMFLISPPATIALKSDFICSGRMHSSSVWGRYFVSQSQSLGLTLIILP